MDSPPRAVLHKLHVPIISVLTSMKFRLLVLLVKVVEELEIRSVREANLKESDDSTVEERITECAVWTSARLLPKGRL